jgi:vesicle coat complex subunit
VVAESVVVIKRLLQTQAGDHIEIIEHMAKLVDSITEPAARSAILWVLGEYSERVPKIAPDVLRKMAKSFSNEDPQVKYFNLCRVSTLACQVINKLKIASTNQLDAGQPIAMPDIEYRIQLFDWSSTLLNTDAIRH